jgi:hypothetical protein
MSGTSGIQFYKLCPSRLANSGVEYSVHSAVRALNVVMANTLTLAMNVHFVSVLLVSMKHHRRRL